jgi:hypothetical protein
LEILAAAPLVQLTYARLIGRPAPIIDALRRSRGRYASVLCVGILGNLPTVISIVVFSFSNLILTVVWYLIISAFWYVAASAVLIEDTGVLVGLKRSASLTKGYRWRVFGISLIASLAPGLAEHFLDRILFPVLGGNIAVFIDFALRFLAISAGTIVGTTAYRCLRIAKEGPAVQTLSEVFA